MSKARAKHRCPLGLRPQRLLRESDSLCWPLPQLLTAWFGLPLLATASAIDLHGLDLGLAFHAEGSRCKTAHLLSQVWQIQSVRRKAMSKPSCSPSQFLRLRRRPLTPAPNTLADLHHTGLRPSSSSGSNCAYCFNTAATVVWLLCANCYNCSKKYF